MSEADKSPLDPFTQFWTDTMSKMGGSGAANAPVMPGMGGAAGSANPFEAIQEEAARQMRRGMLDAWAKSCEEYLGSPQFLEVMKQSMDSVISVKKSVANPRG